MKKSTEAKPGAASAESPASVATVASPSHTISVLPSEDTYSPIVIER